MKLNKLLCVIFVGISALLSTCANANKGASVEDALTTIRAIELKLTTSVDLNDYNAAKESPQQRIATGELLILSLHLNSYYLGEVAAIKSAQSVHVSLSDLFDILQFAMNVDVSNRTAQGVGANQQPLSLNAVVTPAVFTSSSQSYFLAKNQITIEDDIYVDIESLHSVLNLEFNIDYPDLELFISSEIPLPVELQRYRQSRNFKSANKKSPPTLPWKASPYQALSSPVADLQLNFTASDDKHSTNYSLLGTQDFAYLSAEYFLAGRSTDLLTNSRLTFTKQNLDKNIENGFMPTEISFGDVIATQVGNNYNSQYARGIKVSNNVTNKIIVNNQINLSGAIQPGWDVELYRNEILIDQQLSLADGRYIFDNIDLLFGANNFELIFYGPQGQVERKSDYYFVDGNQLKEGQGNYELSVTEQGKQLLNNNVFNSQGHGWQVAGRYEQGLTNNVSVYSAAFGQKNSDDDLLKYAFGTNISVFDRLLLNANIEKNNKNEQEFEFTARTQLAEQSLLFSASNRTDEEQQDFNSYQINLAGGLMNNIYGRLSYQNNFLYDDSDTRGHFKQVRNQLNYSYSGFALSNQLLWQHDNSSKSTFGTTRFQKRFGRTYTRFGVDYRLSPVSEIVSYEAEFSRKLSRDLQAELTLTDSLSNNIQSAELGLNWQSDKLSLTSNVNYNSNDDWRLGIYSRFSLGFDVENNTYFISKRSLTNTGSLMLRVFLDQNNNGIMDDDERGIAGVKVKGVHNYRQAITDEHGIALLTSMPANRTTDIILDRDSFEDPFIIPANDGFSITPRAGFVEYMDFALNNASEVEGVVYQQKGDDIQVQPFASVSLLNKKGEQIAQAQAAYDGYYLFTDLKPGQYKAVINDEYKQRKKLKSTQNVNVSLPPEGDVVMGVDLTLKALSEITGAIANAGSFSSLNILKIYYRLIAPKIEHKKAFYIHDKVKNKFILALGYAKEISPDLISVCNAIKAQGLNCTVEKHKILH
ncbi:hypothetical protein [Pseudoalteromonas carrageenovora]|uniref:hypothetical protein n=1 Tax=Pseudoalteromonas carrageenovora TaxID=227 RepID=UPI0026E476D1|nr:hypothetical protein [Pseudoalteromonas carrageenovora]MDO6547724.1 hypothetical protein [Pseudoalteromonas carrageenovora]MDO6832419.1 hypothetical protein [Pseudoalteromonas carrageenovora]